MREVLSVRIFCCWNWCSVLCLFIFVILYFVFFALGVVVFLMLPSTKHKCFACCCASVSALLCKNQYKFVFYILRSTIHKSRILSMYAFNGETIEFRFCCYMIRERERRRECMVERQTFCVCLKWQQ